MHMKNIFYFIVSAVLLSTGCNHGSGESAPQGGQIAVQVHGQTQSQTPAAKEDESPAETAAKPQIAEPAEQQPEETEASPAPVPEGCPVDRGLSTDDCRLNYTGVGIFAAMLTLHLDDIKVADLLSDAQANSDDPKCVPSLNKFTKQVHGHWYHHICRKADMRDVREIINDANKKKVFCQRVYNKDGTWDWDLYSSKRIQDYVVEKLKESNPELCK